MTARILARTRNSGDGYRYTTGQKKEKRKKKGRRKKNRTGEGRSKRGRDREKRRKQPPAALSFRLGVQVKQKKQPEKRQNVDNLQTINFIIVRNDAPTYRGVCVRVCVCSSSSV